jgi:thymidine kinase
MIKIKKCVVCGKKINIVVDKFEDEEFENEYSNDGIQLPTENDNYEWFCNSCHHDLINNIKINAVDILHELDEEEKEKEKEDD